MTLSEFLCDRIDEDEAIARHIMDWREAPNNRELRWEQTQSDPRAIAWGLTCVGAAAEPLVATHIIRHDPARVLAECDAKRRIVEVAQEAQMHAAEAHELVAYTSVRVFQELERVLHILALPYADHPDYKPEWRV